ncbi:Hsp20 family protein [Candidatus Phytoplasma solani]|uniref:Hsp20 family chaperone n=1 Tax=Candidatus Phytoplasma solani TaxID=69896 RepID=A0A421NYD4_9MOLU|nr:Hsp20 family protein [Candidatus Phytoplasma solani]RMI88940.1 Hsp20 family chaperone [Candidatus Phytoplasma solani]CCP88201.1 Hsp20 family chaperone [Candidatus Phytoplasma solani]CCP88695.1 Hsp20 family chaperone [Candidatus Phytoplasma solani]
MLFNLINQEKDLFDDLFFETKSIMKTDVQEKDNQYLITIELPGFKKEDVKVALQKGYLIVEAKTAQENEEKENNFLRKERLQGLFRRNFYLGEGFTLEDVKGTLEEGLLKLAITKKEKKEIEEKRYLELK